MADILEFPIGIGSIATPPVQVDRNGPALWDTLLEAVDYPGAVVAGGCIRDYFLGLEPKDIDIFIPCNSRQEFDELVEALNDSRVWGLTVHHQDAEYNTHDPDGIIGVAEGEAIGLPVNIIARCSHLLDDVALIKSFDFGILQTCYRDERVVSTAQAAIDLALKNATLTHNRTYEQSLARFERFTTRNPRSGVLLVNPYA